MKLHLIGTDTVRFTLDKGMFATTSLRGFHGPMSALSRTASKDDKRQGLYRPKLTFTPLDGSLTIEVSLPKLLFGENLQEITCEHKNLILKALCATLADWDIITDAENLLAARLTRIDVGKNLLLTGITSSLQVIDLLKRCKISGRKIPKEISYTNGGRALRVHNASSDLLIYDKLRAPELCGISEKLSIEPDQYCQKSLCDMLNMHNHEVLRIERRFNGRKAVRRLFAKWLIKNPCLADIFTSEIGYHVISEEWKRLVAACILPDKDGTADLGRVVELLQKNANGSLRNTLAYCFIQNLLKNYSMEDLRRAFKPVAGNANVNNFFKQMQTWNGAMTTEQNVLQIISEKIEEWAPFRLPSTIGENKSGF